MTPAELVEQLDDLLRSELASLEVELAAVATALRLDDREVARFVAAHHLHLAVEALLDCRDHDDALARLAVDRLRRLVPWWPELVERARTVDEVAAAVLGERAGAWRVSSW